jgi:hypothetical protein
MSFAKLMHTAGLVSVFAGALIALAKVLRPQIRLNGVRPLVREAARSPGRLNR